MPLELREESWTSFHKKHHSSNNEGWYSPRSCGAALCYHDDEEDGKNWLDSFVEIILPDCSSNSKKLSKRQLIADDSSYASLDSSSGKQKGKQKGFKKVLSFKNSKRRKGNIKISHFSR